MFDRENLGASGPLLLHLACHEAHLTEFWVVLKQNNYFDLSIRVDFVPWFFVTVHSLDS